MKIRKGRLILLAAIICAVVILDTYSANEEEARLFAEYN